MKYFILFAFFSASLVAMHPDSQETKKQKDILSFTDQLTMKNGIILKPVVDEDRLLLTEWKDGVCAEKCLFFDVYQVTPLFPSPNTTNLRIHGLASIARNIIMALVVASETRKDDAIYLGILDFDSHIGITKVVRKRDSYSGIQVEAIPSGDLINIVLKAHEEFQYSVSFNPDTMKPSGELSNWVQNI